MVKMLMNYNPELGRILTEYRNFLATNNINSLNSLDYIFEIINYYEISKKYFEKFEFNDSLKCNGVFIPEQRKIVLNTSLLDCAYKLHFISFEQMIMDFFSILLHEINHLLQFRYRDLVDDDIAFVLNISEFLKHQSSTRKKELHDLFPDEIDSNIRSSKLIYEVEKSELAEKNLVFFLTLCTIYKNRIINSQIDYLYEQLFKSKFDEEIGNINSIYYGLEKDKDLLQAIVDSYQSHSLCVDIDGGRRLKKCN
ncbi:MAG: hypothetical protein ACI4XR_02295 [Bacilli bacterium]